MTHVMKLRRTRVVVPAIAAITAMLVLQAPSGAAYARPDIAAAGQGAAAVHADTRETDARILQEASAAGAAGTGSPESPHTAGQPAASVHDTATPTPVPAVPPPTPGPDNSNAPLALGIAAAIMAVAAGIFALARRRRTPDR